MPWLCGAPCAHYSTGHAGVASLSSGIYSGLFQTGHYPRQIFPGRNAGASLKLDGRRSVSAFGGIFPGRNVGASLKPTVGRSRPQWPAYLPRQKCRGLIEACAGGMGARCHRDIFPGRNAGASLKFGGLGQPPLPQGDLPRQKCRGLIEAPPPRRPTAALVLWSWHGLHHSCWLAVSDDRYRRHGARARDPHDPSGSMWITGGELLFRCNRPC